MTKDSGAGKGKEPLEGRLKGAGRVYRGMVPIDTSTHDLQKFDLRMGSGRRAATSDSVDEKVQGDWYAVYAGGSHFDLTPKDEPVMFVQYKHHAEELIKKLWPESGYAEPVKLSATYRKTGQESKN